MAGLVSAAKGKAIDVDPNWPWEFVRRRYPRRDVRVEPRPARSSGPITLSWVVPPWKVGSGGHTAIFHLVEQLERRGHSCAIYVFDSFGREKRPAHELREEIIERFIPVEAPVFTGLDEFTPSDVCLATNWRTAWAARDLPGCGEKLYLVQDHEPEFFAASAEALFVEETYRMGYRCIAAHTSWMAERPTRSVRPRDPSFRVCDGPRRLPLRRRGRPRAGTDHRVRAAGGPAAAPLTSHSPG